MNSNIIPIETPSGTFKVWTSEQGSRPSRRLLLLHGGPGANHGYFRSFEEHISTEELSWIYYDQLGSDRSDAPDDLSLWSIERFVEEVEQVRKALNLHRDNFFLLGHSWGGILAVEYALKYQQHLKGLIISNMMASCIKYQEYADQVLGPNMDRKVLARIRELESMGMYDSPEYMELLMPHHYEKHVLRKPADQWPEEVTDALSRTNQQIYVHMQGPSEFGISGTLEKWDRFSDLKQISVPALVIGAEYDTMDPEHMRLMADTLPKGSYLHCPEGSHLSMWDDSEVYHRGIVQFIAETDCCP